MKINIFKFSNVIAAFALIITTAVANSTCIWFTHQEKLPENAKALRKF